MMIDGHVWRPTGNSAGKVYHQTPSADRPCWFMNCRRARAEHTRAAKRYTSW